MNASQNTVDMMASFNTLDHLEPGFDFSLPEITVYSHIFKNTEATSVSSNDFDGAKRSPVHFLLFIQTRSSIGTSSATIFSWMMHCTRKLLTLVDPHWMALISRSWWQRAIAALEFWIRLRETYLVSALLSTRFWLAKLLILDAKNGRSWACSASPSSLKPQAWDPWVTSSGIVGKASTQAYMKHGWVLKVWYILHSLLCYNNNSFSNPKVAQLSLHNSPYMSKTIATIFAISAICLFAVYKSRLTSQ